MKIKDLTPEKFHGTIGMSVIVELRDGSPDWAKTSHDGRIPLKNPDLIDSSNQQKYLHATINGKKRSFGGGTRVVFQ